ncbi:MAG TPA: hypothetical protein VN397_02930 [Candidatus Methylomirabilis sp.]|nr:hypothetical protein [Candidatus Methylomirabilis sp.]
MNDGTNVRPRATERVHGSAISLTADGVAMRPVPTCEFGPGGAMGLYTYNVWCPGQLERYSRLSDGFRTYN